MNIFKVLGLIGKVATGTEKVTSTVNELQGIDFSQISKFEALEKLNPALNAFIDLAQIVTGDEGDKKLEEIRTLLNDISKP